MRGQWLFLTFILSSLSCLGQTVRITIVAFDSLTQHPLPGVAISRNGSSFLRHTNQNGSVILETTIGDQELEAVYPEYKPFRKRFQFNADSSISLFLSRQDKLLDEVIVRANDFKNRISTTRTSVVEITQQQLERIPTLLGEKDIVKALLLTPGIKTQTEGSTAMYVRGGGADQNLLLLNGTPIYYSSHLFGLLTPYNPDVLSRASLSKGGFPAWYGGRLSSVLDVDTRTASLQKTELRASIGLLSARVMVGQPIVKNKLSLLVAGRRSFLDAILIPNPDSPAPRFSFYDVDSKLLFQPNSRHTIIAYTHLDQDFIRYEQNSAAVTSHTDYRWRNQLGGMNWQYNLNKRTNIQADASLSSYRMQVNSEINASDFLQSRDFRTGITDYSIKAAINHRTQKVEYIAGVQYTNQSFDIGSLKYQMNLVQGSSNNQTARSSLLSVYEQTIIPFTARLKASAGMRISWYENAQKTYHSVEPRLTLNQQITEESSLKLAYNRMQQPIHLLSNPGIGVPLDLWLPAANGLAPAYAQQVSIGYLKQIYVGKKPLLISVESYYKTLRNTVSYKDGYSSTDIVQFSQYETPSLTTLITVGQGRAYGLELMLEKKGEKLSGWLGYTLAWVQHQFPDLNRGRWFYPTYDRRHDISLSLSYQLGTRWLFSVNWLYGTGQAVTLPLLAYNVPATTYVVPSLPANTQLLYTQSDRNAYRMLPYHRLDVSFRRTTARRWGESTFEIGLYNAYNRRNPFFYQLALQNERPILQSVSLLPLLPALSYSIKLR